MDIEKNYMNNNKNIQIFKIISNNKEKKPMQRQECLQEGGGARNRPKVISIIIIIIIIIMIVIVFNDLARVYPTPGVVFLSANILPGTDILNLQSKGSDLCHQYVRGGWKKFRF